MRSIRNFVASATDMATERAKVGTVAGMLKPLADALGIVLDVVDWRAAVPDMGRPEQVILEQLKPTEWDVFIGILWHRFGTPPGGRSQQAQRDYFSGTEEEFKNAFRLWKQYGRPRLMIYRCTRPIPPDALDPDQFKRVKDFFAQFEAAGGEHPGLYQTFDTTDAFERLLLDNLQRLLLGYGEQLRGAPVEPQVIQTLAPKIPNNLPRRAAFFGRHKDMEVVMRTLSPEDRTWGVLIDGIGGIGKTSLAVEAAHRCKESGRFEAFVFVSAKQHALAPGGIREVPPAARTLDEFLNETARILDQPGIPKLASDPKRRALLDALRERPTLLVYDNLETLSKEEQEALADFLRELPQGCKAVITSRRRGGEGSVWLRLEKLDWEAARQLIAAEADRDASLAAKLQRADGSGWQQLYDATGGSPLALSHTLGLMRVRAALSFDDALDLLRGNRDANLQQFIFMEARRELTTNDEAALRALSFFVPSATFEAWAEVAQISRTELETTIDRLSALSLVDVLPDGEENFALHPLTRNFVRGELLADTLIARETGARFAYYWVAYAKRYGGWDENYKTFRLFEAEWANLGVSADLLWEMAGVRGDGVGDENAAKIMNTFASDLCSAEGPLYYLGQWDQTIQLSTHAYEAMSVLPDWSEAGWRAHEVAWIYYKRGLNDEAEHWADRCAEAWKRGGSKHQQATGTRMCGLVAQQRKDYDAAERLLQEALASWRDLANETWLASVLNSLGSLERKRKRYDAAERHYQEALDLYEKLDAKEKMTVYGSLGLLELDRGRWAEAREWFEKQLPLAREVGRLDLIAHAQHGLARVHEAEDRPALALLAAQEALEIYERLQHRDLPLTRELVEALRKPKLKAEALEPLADFFERAGFERVERLPNNILGLQPRLGERPALATLWGALSNPQEVSEVIVEYQRKFAEVVKFYLVYSVRPPSGEIIRSLRESTRASVILLQWSFVNNAQASPNVEQELREIEEPYLVRSDPYFESKPINDPNWFFGRDELLNRLTATLGHGQHVGVFGLRKVGKTSLVNQLRQKYVLTPTIFIDSQAFQPRARTYFNEIIVQLHAELASRGQKNLPGVKKVPDVEGFRNAFLSLFKSWQDVGGRTRFLIIFDEIDKLFPGRGLKGGEKITGEYVRLFRVLRGLAQVQKCLVTLIVAYRPDINRQNLLHSSVGDNPMFQALQEEYLGFLSGWESESMIRDIGLWKDIRWDPEAAQRVFHYCAGHPLITRFFASQACEEGTLKQIDLDRVEQTARHIVSTFRRNEIGNYYKEGIFDVLREGEQEALKVICKGPDLGTPELNFDPDLEGSLTNLERFGLIANVEGKLRVTADLFDTWLRRRFHT